MTAGDRASNDRSDDVAVTGGPLDGVKVVDLTQMLAGPYATMILADLGADVVKVEPPSGDLTRAYGPHLEEGEAYGGYFNSVNRNKRSIVLDLKTEEGVEAFQRLAENADVVVENFRVGTMERLGIPYETLQSRNPRLVYASIRGFGDPRLGESPYAERPAFDLIAQAMGGVMSITGTEASGPTKVGPGIGDIFPATLSVCGLLAALRHRDATGEGQFVDVGMVDSILSLTERIVHQYAYEGEVPGPQGNTHPFFFPFDRFETSDGYIVIAAPTDGQWEALCQHMERPELAREYSDQESRASHADELRKVVNDWTRQFNKEELFDLLESDVPCGPVNTIENIFEDDHFEARMMLPSVEHADTGQSVRIAGTPIKFSDTPGGVRRRAPFLGEHTIDVLAENGFDQDAISNLIKSEVAVSYAETD